MAGDSHVVLHYDKSADAAGQPQFAKLVETSGGRFHIAEPVDVRWGEWSIVRATLNAIDVLRELGKSFDYVSLLSGSCYVSKPMALMDEYLAKNQGVEFIESYDGENHRWIIEGSQSERWRLYHWFNWKATPRLYSFATRIQKRLGIRRALPHGMTPRIGSQWWTLTWSTLVTIIEMSRDGALDKYYRRTWIPDEHFFQTLVYHVVPDKARIKNHNLMQYSFDDYGKPRVFYNDNYCNLVASSRFFCRKIAPSADALRENLDCVANMAPTTFLAHINTPLGDHLLSSEPVMHPISRPGVYCFTDVILEDGLKRAKLERPDKQVAINYFVVICRNSSVLDEARKLINQHDKLCCHGRLFASDRIELEVSGIVGRHCESYSVEQRDADQLGFFEKCLEKRDGQLSGFLMHPGEDISARHLLWQWVTDPQSLVLAINSCDETQFVETAMDLVDKPLRDSEDVNANSPLDYYINAVRTDWLEANASTDRWVSSLLAFKHDHLLRLHTEHVTGSMLDEFYAMAGLAGK